uniref:Neural cell adhesion molecule 1 n=1 Tax=Anas zonorhyncha TaxID=75864 RepID=A0A8B9UAF1_9AVES
MTGWEPRWLFGSELVRNTVATSEIRFRGVGKQQRYSPILQALQVTNICRKDSVSFSLHWAFFLCSLSPLLPAFHSFLSCYASPLHVLSILRVSIATRPLTESESTEPPTGEPSAPKLEGQMGEDGNSIKVNVIKQDDGGSPIRHYLIKYKAKHSSEWKPEIRLPSGSDHVMLKSLDWNAEYEVSVIAENQQGKSKPAHYAFRTSAQPTVIPATLGSPSTSSSFVSLLLSAVTLLLLC